MAPFEFDLNELPPEDDGASDTSPCWAPEPAGVPSQHDPLPLPPALQSTAHDLPPAHVPESSPHNPLPASAHDLPPAPVPDEPSSHDLPPAAVSEPSPHDLLPAPVPEKSHDPLPVPVPESSPHNPLASPTSEPSPTAEPSPHDPLHPPSPVLDLEGPLSSLDDDDDDDYEYDEEDLPPPPAGPPPFGQAVVAAAPARSSSSVDTPSALPVRCNRRRERTSRPRASQEPFALSSSPENSAPRGLSRSASGTELSRRNPYAYVPRGGDDMISKQRRVVGDYDDDAGSSRSGSRRSELASPPQFEEGGRRHAPAKHGQPGVPPRNRRRRRRPQKAAQHGYQYQGPVEKQPEQQQGFRGQERPQVHQRYRGPHHGPEVTKVGYSSYGPFDRLGSSDVQNSPEREPINNGNGGYYHQRRETPPVRTHSRPHSYHDGRQEPPKFAHTHREAPSLSRPSSGAQRPVDVGAYQQQRKAPRGRERFSDRSYHPYARDGGAFYKTDGGGGHQARREPQPSYEHRRDSKQQRMPGGPARGHQYYGD